MNAYWTKGSIVDGVKVEVGDGFEGFYTSGKILSVNDGYCETEEEVRDRANEEWTTKYLGKFKELTIKMDGKIIAHHSNFEVNKYGKKYFKKKG